MKKSLFFIFVSILCVSIYAEQVPLDRAQTVAENWAAHLRTTFNDPAAVVSGETILREGTVVAYVFHLHPRGYILVSAEDYLPPVKIYSLKNNFGEEGKELEELVFNQYAHIIEKVNHSEILPGQYFDERNKQNFMRLSGDPRGTGQPSFQPAVFRVEEVRPLVATTWSQGTPYNLKCPMVNGERCVTGCVATAFAQIMKYYEYPPAGRLDRGYISNTHRLSVWTSFNHPYYWDQMLNAYPEPDSGTGEQRDAISQLMFDVGVALSMDYAPDGSGAYPSLAVTSFPIYFDYSREILYVSRMGWDDAGWFQLAKDQVDAGFPVALSIYRVGAGHMVVIDGYRISNGTDTFHINMGWGGSYDAYYSLNNIVVKGDRQYSILEWQEYVLNMVPPGRENELPPMPIGASAHMNRSLFQKEYCCELTWQGIPGVNNDIDRYEIIRYKGYTGEQIILAEVDHTGQSELYHYTFRSPEYTPDFFIVRSVNHAGGWSPLLYCHLVLN